MWPHVVPVRPRDRRRPFPRKHLCSKIVQKAAGKHVARFSTSFVDWMLLQTQPSPGLQGHSTATLASCFLFHRFNFTHPKEFALSHFPPCLKLIGCSSAFCLQPCFIMHHDHELCSPESSQGQNETQFLSWCSDNGVEAPSLRMGTFEHLRGVEAASRIEPGEARRRLFTSALFLSCVHKFHPLLYFPSSS